MPDPDQSDNHSQLEKAMDWDDVQPKKATAAAIGDNLENLSVAELDQHIIDLRAEIERVEKERERKVKLGAAADQVFKS